MVYETKISYEQDGKAVKAQYIIEHADLFGEVESKLYEEFGNFPNFSVVSIKTNNKIREIINQREDEEDFIWIAELQDVFHTDEGDEKHIRYKVIIFAKTFDSAKTKIVKYIQQGYDMTLISLKLTNFEEVL